MFEMGGPYSLSNHPKACLRNASPAYGAPFLFCF